MHRKFENRNPNRVTGQSNNININKLKKKLQLTIFANAQTSYARGHCTEGADAAVNKNDLTLSGTQADAERRNPPNEKTSLISLLISSISKKYRIKK